MSSFQTIGQVKEANQAIGHHWFDTKAKRFFRSKIHSGILYEHWFVHSLQFEDSSGKLWPRQFKPAFVSHDGSIHDVGVEFTTRKDCKQWIDDHQDRFSDSCDGSCYNVGNSLCVRYPLGGNSSVFLCYSCVCRENASRLKNDDTRSQWDYFRLCKTPFVWVSFVGRNKGAIGIDYPIETQAYSGSREDIELQLYERYDHISKLKIG